MSILAQLLQSTDVILCSGGDDRQAVVAGSSEKLNKYFCSTVPRDDVIRRGSCTCSTVNSTDFLAAEQYRLELLTRILQKDTEESREREVDDSFQEVIGKLKALFGQTGEIVLFPSGSDAEYLPLLLALVQSRAFLTESASSSSIKVFNNIIAAGEVGSGTFWAASGQHFSTITPSGEASSAGNLLKGIGADWVEGVQFLPRNDQGDVDLHEDEIIDTIHRQMSSSACSVSVLHVVLGSKTGLVYPRWEKVQSLQSIYQKRLVIVLDACQFRCSFSTLSRYVAAGCVVLFTGSKYYCGPPFSGGVVLPTQAVEAIEKYLDESTSTAVTAEVVPEGLTAYLSYHQVGRMLSNLRKRLREVRPNSINLGLYLRWCVALNTMEAHAKLSEQQLTDYRSNWTGSIRTLIAQHKEYLTELQDPSEIVKVQGIISLLLSVDNAKFKGTKRQLTPEECRVFHRLMTLNLGGCGSGSAAAVSDPISDVLKVIATPSELMALSARAMIGQPVSLSATTGRAVVRLALGADIVLRLSRGQQFEVAQEDGKVVQKMSTLLKYWDKISTAVQKQQQQQQQQATEKAAIVVPTHVSMTADVSARMMGIDSALHVTAALDLATASLSQAATISTALQTHFNDETQRVLPDVSVIYDLTSFDRNISLASSAFQRLSERYTTRHCFAVKSCPLTYVLHYAVNHRGTGLECASVCEVRQALRVGCDPQYVIFDCPCKTEDEIYFALSQHVTLNANSYVELAKIKRALSRLDSQGMSSRSIIGLRVNPMVGGGANAALSTATASSKFGIPLSNVETNDTAFTAAPAKAAASVDNDKPKIIVEDYTEQIVQAYVEHRFLTAIMCHVGSQGMPLRLMSLGAKRILDLADLIDQRCGCSGGGGGGPARIKMVDIGGGISANYSTDEVKPTFEDYVEDLVRTCKSLTSSSVGASKRILITEFGKGLIAKCGYITSRIEDVLHSPSVSLTAATAAAAGNDIDTVSVVGDSVKVVAIGHAGADLLLRTAYCPSKFPHRVILLDQHKKPVTESERAVGTVTIAGPLCFSGDIVAENLPNFPIPVRGDVCVVLDAGANTLSLFSRHCSRMSPRVYAFRGNHLAMISEGETEEDVMRFWD